MTEILTESFCERCGTRYTFETAAPRRSRVGRVRTVSRGLRNFVLSDETTLSEAMADARSEEERSATTNQLDAFHKTFNFCLTCRQYTCGNCWNTAEGRCLTCVPLPGMEKDAQLLVVPAIAFAPNGNGAHVHDGVAAEPGVDGWPEVDLGPEAWPEADVGVERVGLALGAAAIADAPDEAEAAAQTAPDAEAEAPALEAWPTDDELAAAEAEARAEADADDGFVMLDDAAVEARINGVAPGQSVEDAVAAYEAQLAAEEERERQTALAAAALVSAVEAEPEPEVVAEVEAFAEPEPVGEVAPEPVTFEESVDWSEAVAAAAIADEAEAVAAPAIAEADAWPEPIAEPELVAAEVAAEPEPDHAGLAAAALLAAATEPEIAEAEPEPAVAAEPEAVAAEPEVIAWPEPIAEPELVAAAEVAAEPEPDHAGLAAAALLAAATEPEAPAAREDIVAQPTWPVAAAPVEPAAAPAPEPTPAPEPAQPAVNPWLTVAPDDGSTAPQWPVAPAWGTRASSRNGQPATLAGRPLVPQDNAASLWAASAREVLTGGARAPEPTAAASLTPQPCVSCGLSLSANARFCRRCGTRQG